MRLLIRALPARLGTRRPPKRALPIRLVTPLPRVRMTGAAADGLADPAGKAKKEAADYLEALQRERAEFVNYRNRAQREQERFRQHGIIDVLTALLPALDDIDRIREHSEMDDSFKAVANKIEQGVREVRR